MVPPGGGKEFIEEITDVLPLYPGPGYSEKKPHQPAPGKQKPPREPRFKLPAARPSRIALIGAGTLAAVGALYFLDIALTSGEVPRGVEVAGISVGGLDHRQVDAVLRHELDHRLAQPHPVIAGEVDTEFVPEAAGLGVDYDLTIAGLPKQSWNPFTRLTSYFTTTEGNLVTPVNEAKLNRGLDKIKGVAQRDKVEGSVRINDGRVIPIYPLNGQNLIEDQARTAIIDGWSEDGPVEVPVHVDPTGVTEDAVSFAINGIANPAVVSDVAIKGKGGAKAVLKQGQVGQILRFEPDGGGGLKPVYNYDAAVKILAPQLASTDVQATDATFVATGNGVTVTKSSSGEVVDWPETLDLLPNLLQQTIGPREVDAIYKKVTPKLTQEQANDLGIRQVIGQFEIGTMDWWSGVNVRNAAAQLNGTVIKPGETFSFNDVTGPRTAEEGYAAAPMIVDGRPSKAAGGGVSYLATAIYNAAYESGLNITKHKAFPYWDKKTPVGRDAWVDGQGADLQIKNDSKHGVLIEVYATTSRVTVKLWGTKTVDVELTTSDKRDFTGAVFKQIPKGPTCVWSDGAEGFTVTDTRVITDLETGKEIDREKNEVKYGAKPKVACV